MAQLIRIVSYQLQEGVMVRIASNLHRSRVVGRWANTEVEVVEFDQLSDIARPLGSGRLSLRAALRETGGKIDARHQPSRPLEGAYRGNDHLSLIAKDGEAYGHTQFIKGFRCVAVHFPDELLRQACESEETPPAFTTRLMFENRAMWAIADKLAMECVTPKLGRQLYCESLVGQLAVEIARFKQGDALAANKGGLAPYRLRRIVDYIEGHIGEDISMLELAALAELSLPHFMRAFRASTGEAPLRFIMKRRVKRAQALLLETDFPLIKIAHDCGFADQAHMTTCFRRLEGNTPARFRRDRS
ncbi:helix-turn-helix domain-containing protein [Cupriavidus sp. CuC1]|uniref:AraC family transcriptional regulator n=1 Tax=Cupriavidus sp. CuC1 TaxID=3373131 RepID=UPI0037D3E3E3